MRVAWLTLLCFALPKVWKQQKHTAPLSTITTGSNNEKRIWLG
jgi:hypothetical protein